MSVIWGQAGIVGGIDPRKFSWRQINRMYVGKVKHDWTQTAAIRADLRAVNGNKVKWHDVYPFAEKPPKQSLRDVFRQACMD